jgi:hypothetical protein
MFTEKIIATIVLMCGAIGMIIARRTNLNKFTYTSDVGAGIAGWTLVLLIIMWSH